MDYFDQYATDPELEAKGTWVPQPGGSKLLIARSGNRAYSKLLNSLVEENQEILNANDDVADKTSEEISVKVMAKTILLGWEGVTYKGASLPYTLDNAVMLLGHRDFRMLVGRLADKQANYRLKKEVEMGEA